MERMEILFGFSDNKVEDALKRKMYSKDIDAHIISRVSKATIQDYVDNNPQCNTVILRERLSAGSVYTAEEVAKLTDKREVNVIILISARHIGSEYVKTLLAANITGAVFQQGKHGGITIQDMANMILHKRSRAEAREYYGIAGQKLDMGSIDNDTYTNFYRDLTTGDGNIIENFIKICSVLSPMQIADFTRRLPKDDIDELVKYDEFHTIVTLLREFGHDLRIKKPKKTVLGVQKPVELSVKNERIVVSVEKEEEAQAQNSHVIKEEMISEKREEEDFGMSLTELLGMIENGESLMDEPESVPCGGKKQEGEIDALTEEKGIETNSVDALEREIPINEKPKQEPGGKKSAKKVLKEKESKNKEHGIYEELGEDKASFYSYEEDEDYDNVVFSYEGKAFPGGVVITIVLVLCVVLILLFFPDLKQLIVG